MVFSNINEETEAIKNGKNASPLSLIWVQKRFSIFFLEFEIFTYFRLGGGQTNLKNNNPSTTPQSQTSSVHYMKSLYSFRSIQTYLIPKLVNVLSIKEKLVIS